MGESKESVVPETCGFPLFWNWSCPFSVDSKNLRYAVFDCPSPYDHRTDATPVDTCSSRLFLAPPRFTIGPHRLQILLVEIETGERGNAHPPILDHRNIPRRDRSPFVPLLAFHHRAVENGGGSLLRDHGEDQATDVVQADRNAIHGSDSAGERSGDPAIFTSITAPLQGQGPYVHSHRRPALGATRDPVRVLRCCFGDRA